VHPIDDRPKGERDGFKPCTQGSSQPRSSRSRQVHRQTRELGQISFGRCRRKASRTAAHVHAGSSKAYPTISTVPDPPRGVGRSNETCR
jgi:hypothetical protein